MRTRRAPFALALLATALLVAGCDTAATSGERVFLQPRDVTFRFSYSSDAFQAGVPVTVTSNGAVDLTGRLDGFKKSEIVGAKVTNVVLTRVQPVNANGRFDRMMAALAVQLVGAGGAPATVGASAALPNAATATFAGTSTDVSAILAGEPFRARLAFTPPTALREDYEVDVTFTLAVEVEGI